MHARSRITSTSNERLKELRRQAARPGRARETVLVEGYRLLLRAVEAAAVVETVYAAPSLFSGPDAGPLVDRAEGTGARVVELGRAAFVGVSSQTRPDGLLAVVRRPSASLAQLPVAAVPLVVVCEAVERPGNLGTIVRTADAAGATALVACDPQVDVFQPKTVSASLGGIFRLPVAVAATETAIAWLRERGIQVAVASPGGELEPWAADLRGPTALVLGSEKRGISRVWLEAADVRIGIPMPGGGPDSLNVGVAAGVLLVEAVRQRSGSHDDSR
jgi:RNA methyltransferase, TrmH family